MSWVLVSAIVGGLVVGFMAGASRAPTGGNVAAAVAAIQLGLLGFVANRQPPSRVPEDVGKLFVVFLTCLVVAYVAANVLRARGKLEWMGISRG